MTRRAAVVLCCMLTLCSRARAGRAVQERVPSASLAVPTAPPNAARPPLLPAAASGAAPRAAASGAASPEDAREERTATADVARAAVLPATVYDGAEAPRSGVDESADSPLPVLSTRQFALQSGARLKLLAQRAVTLPAHAWPLTRLAKRFSHGEALAGLTPASAIDTAREIASRHGVGTVVGRLSWELRDIWSVRGAARSYAKLIDAAAAAGAKDPSLDIAVSLDIEALGAQLAGMPLEQRARLVKDNVSRLARRARAAGIPVELDIGAVVLMPVLLETARAVAEELNMPLRLALAARYPESERALRDWAALARALGLRLGVRLVKGSFIEADQPGAINVRGPLIAQYKRLVTAALSHAHALDVVVATQNEEVWRHARAERRRLGAEFSIGAIRGIGAPLQREMRAAGDVSREYVSYGVDTVVMALLEKWTNWRHRRALARVDPAAAID
jgi:hypothetical protein